MSAVRVGLTGGIGSGKSTVAALLSARGAKVIDTDAISRALTAPQGAALPAIAAAFGADMVDEHGALDRARMRQLAFGQAPEALQAKQTLEHILHPLIQAETARQAAQAEPGQPLVFDVPLLAESAHWRGRVDKVLVIDCSEATQIRRVMARSGWPAQEVQRVIALQATRAERRAIADAVILNDGLSLAQLQAELDALWQQGFFGPAAAPGV
ncbi:dephospho-CoA kinase [Ideonella azotifigens]|uniref:dephospho-CoA kinase n=1 Tax=Ideonella azotifigens TaxID=513160 RepID=UPI001142C7D8|nr:dephospho-CoA kinase [Ideonella azotifigens]MCD2339493.1 dephospho-CoA kinase [Ideonella azotifigens]